MDVQAYLNEVPEVIH